MSLTIRRALVAAAVLAAAATTLVPAPAGAHSVCDQASPADGSTVDRAPSEASCLFTEPLLPDSIMEIYDACNRRADDGNVVVAGYRMSVGMTATAPGKYRVRWLTHSAQDGHYAGPGTVVFTVRGTPPACPGAGSPTPSASATAPASAPASPTTSTSPSPTKTSASPSASPSPLPASGSAAPSPGSTAGAIPPPLAGEEESARDIAGAAAGNVALPIALLLLVVVPLGAVPALLVKPARNPEREAGTGDGDRS